MHKYLVLSAVILPLIGVYQMEQGAFGNSIGAYGYPNGATLIYALYATVLVSAFSCSYALRGHEPAIRPSEKYDFYGFSLALLLSLLVALLAMLFGFDAYRVWSGEIGKGEFRANLGSFGALAYLLINAVIPFLVAFASAIYRTIRPVAQDKLMLAAIYVLTLVVGSTWGFKGTGVNMLIPSLMILYWGASLWKVLRIAVATVIAIIAMFYFFDNGSDEYAQGISFLWVRLTTLQGDVSWRLWDQYINDVSFPSYFNTLLPFIGDTLFTLFTGVSRDDPNEWANYHFDTLINSLAGLSVGAVSEGHSIVATPFSDGLVMGGPCGVIIMAVFAGTFAGWLCKKLERAITSHDHYKIALLGTYFGMTVFGWLRNGVTLQLFHIATFVGLAISLLLCILFNKLLAIEIVADVSSDLPGNDINDASELREIIGKS